MSVPWSTRLLDALLVLDEAEAPHGLYGVRQAHVLASGRLPTLAQVLLSDRRANFVEPLGLKDHGSQARDNRLSLLIGQSERVELQVLDHASTKVRAFGSAHRLDTHHGKAETEPRWNLEKLVPKLGEAARWQGRNRFPFSQAILLVAHAPTWQGLRGMIGRTAEEGILSRYGVVLALREWADRYERGFHSGLYLWTWRLPSSEGRPTVENL